MTTALEGGEGTASRLGRYLPPVPIAQEVGWAPGPVWTGAENISSTGFRSLDRPARSQSLFQPIMANMRTHNFIPRNFSKTHSTRSGLKKKSATEHKQTKLPVLVPDTRRNFHYIIQEKDYKSCFDEGKLVMSFL
jgi:hypothetical protein